MATLRCSQSSCSRPATRQVAAVSRSRCVVVKAQQDATQQVSRRNVMGAVALSMAALVSSAAPAQAFLGFGEDDSQIFQKYNDKTASLLAEVKTVLDLPKEDESKDDKVKALRQDINTWVAAYRREPKVSGRPSYGNTYSVVNALSGHFNSFGASAPIPKKRLDRIQKELDDASLFLSRNR